MFQRNSYVKIQAKKTYHCKLFKNPIFDFLSELITFFLKNREKCQNTLKWRVNQESFLVEFFPLGSSALLRCFSSINEYM